MTVTDFLPRPPGDRGTTGDHHPYHLTVELRTQRTEPPVTPGQPRCPPSTVRPSVPTCLPPDRLPLSRTRLGILDLRTTYTEVSTHMQSHPSTCREEEGRWTLRQNTEVKKGTRTPVSVRVNRVERPYVVSKHPSYLVQRGPTSGHRTP